MSTNVVGVIAGSRWMQRTALRRARCRDIGPGEARPQGTALGHDRWVARDSPCLAAATAARRRLGPRASADSALDSCAVSARPRRPVAGAPNRGPDGPDAPSLSVRGLVKRYGTVTAVDGLDLTLPPASVLALLGPNGAGKTTTLEVCT